MAGVISLAAVGTFAQRSQPSKTVSLDQSVFHELRKLPNYNVFDWIGFSVDGSTVTLTGKVYSLGTKNDAARFVKSVPGVTKVVNEIEELPISPMDDSIRMQTLRTFAAHGFSRYLWRIDPDVHIIVQRGRVTLEGYVTSKGDKDAMNIYANGISGVFSVQNNLIVGTPIYG